MIKIKETPVFTVLNCKDFRTKGILENIAKKHLNLHTLETRNADNLDFHNFAVWSIKEALTSAFKAGMDYNNPIAMNKLEELNNFLDFLIGLRDIVSNRTHYDKLEIWSKPVYGYVRTKLKLYGFVNGDPEANKNNDPVQFFLNIYNIISNICYSRYLTSETTRHHSSAWERNEALIKEVQYLIQVI